MPALKAGDAFPQGVTFSYIAPTPETSEVTACGIPTKYDASKGTFSIPMPVLQLGTRSIASMS